MPDDQAQGDAQADRPAAPEPDDLPDSPDSPDSSHTADSADPADAADDGGQSGRRKLWSALTGRPSKGQLVAGALLAVLGYAATVQIQLTRSSTDFAGQSRGDLVELLDSLSGAANRAQQQISDLQNQRDELQSGSSSRAAAIAAEQQRLEDLQILAGSVGAQGPGVTVTIADPQSSVTASSLLNGVEELRDAGAEAIQINTTVRVVQSSWFGGLPGALTVDGRAIRAPYVIRVIGSAHTLSDAVGFPGGLADEISSLGGNVTVQENDSLDITALHPVTTPQYARPTGQ